MPPKISSCIICKNQAHRIGLALDSLSWCDEILVVDSGSTDGTIELCQRHPSGKVRVLHQDWLGYNPQRRFAASACKNDWVLMLDADEECDPALRTEIESLPNAALADAAIFEMPRKNYLARRYVRCWSPDHQTRLIHKSRVDWSPQSAPEIRTPKPGFHLKKLRQPLLHNRLTPAVPHDFCDGRRMEEHATILADALAAGGKHATFLDMLTRPALTFFKFYILRGSFLDGRFGIFIAYKTTVGVLLKYSTLYGRELTEKPTADERR